MNSMIKTSMILASVGMAADVAGAGASDLFDLGARAGRVQQAAHIYYNVATGERVVTVLGDSQTSGANTGLSDAVWSVEAKNQCEAFGYTTSWFFAFDDPGSTPLSTAIALSDFGDLATDTVVDCVEINWVVAHPDSDSDMDSVGDGVEDLAGTWAYWDADNGRAEDVSTRTPLIEFTFSDLPGNIFGAGSMTGYTVDVDLVATYTGTDLSFEIGDSDGDCQSAAFCNSSVFDSSTGTFVPIAQADNNNDGLPDSDLDGDGLFDWSWSVRFLQPGAHGDFDGDGVIGDPAPTGSDAIGVHIGAPAGSAIDNGDGTFRWEIDTADDAPGTGAEDGVAFFDADGNHLGLFDFGGFACTGGLLSQGGTGYTPAAMIQATLYTPGAIVPCFPDLNLDGELNFFDVAIYTDAFATCEPWVDWNNDGRCDFFDVSAFLAAFNAGCQ